MRPSKTVIVEAVVTISLSSLTSITKRYTRVALFRDIIALIGHRTVTSKIILSEEIPICPRLAHVQ